VQRRVLEGESVPSAPALSGNEAPQAANVGEIELLSSFGFGTNDQEAMAILTGAGNLNAALSGLNALSVKRATAPKPTQTSTPAPAGGAPIEQENDIKNINDSATLYKMAAKQIKVRG